MKHFVEEEPESIQEAADRQAGRREETSWGHYAVEQKTDNPMKRIRDFELVSAGWHKMCSMKTYPEKRDRHEQMRRYT